MQMMRNKRIWIGIIFCVIVLLIRATGVGNYLSIAHIKMQREWLEHAVARNYWLAAFAYVMAYCATVAFSLPVGAPMTILGGFLFGTIAGVFFANIGATLGAIILFLSVRYFIADALQKKYAQRLNDFNNHMHKEGALYLLFMRLVFVVPFFVVNILAALTNVPLGTFVWTTSLGIIPAALALAYAGQQLMHIDSVRDVFSGRVVIALLLLAMIALTPIVVKRWRKK